MPILTSEGLKDTPEDKFKKDLATHSGPEEKLPESEVLSYYNHELLNVWEKIMDDPDIKPSERFPTIFTLLVGEMGKLLTLNPNLYKLLFPLLANRPREVNLEDFGYGKDGTKDFKAEDSETVEVADEDIQDEDARPSGDD